MTCVDCLRREQAAAAKPKKRFPSLFTPLAGTASFLLLWIYFYSFGNLLLRIPDSFHDGSVWLKAWIDEGYAPEEESEEEENSTEEEPAE